MSRATQTIFAMAGVVLPFAGATAPDGWLLCYGQAVSRTAYAHLFSVIGTTYGTGDGSTTFNVPDLRGRVPAGKDNMGGTAAGRLTNAGTGNPGIDGATLGAAGGVDRHALTTAQMPAHTHGIQGKLYAFNEPGAGSGQLVVHAGVGSSMTSAFSQTLGSGEGHPNAQPTIVLSHIIKT